MIWRLIALGFLLLPLGVIASCGVALPNSEGPPSPPCTVPAWLLPPFLIGTSFFVWQVVRIRKTREKYRPPPPIALTAVYLAALAGSSLTLARCTAEPSAAVPIDASPGESNVLGWAVILFLGAGIQYGMALGAHGMAVIFADRAPRAPHARPGSEA